MPVPLIAARSEIGPLPVVHQLVQECAIRPLFYDHYLVGDLPNTVHLRARVAGHFLPPEAVLGSLTATWIFAGGSPPTQISVLMEPGSSPRVGRWGVHTMRTTITDAEIVHIGGVPVTTMERTIVDLARWAEPAIARTAIARLAAAGANLRAARQLIPYGQRNSQVASELITELIG